MTDSLYKSYRNMTTSMQLAQESYKEKVSISILVVCCSRSARCFDTV